MAYFVMNIGGAYFRKVNGGFIEWVQHIGKANLFDSEQSARYSMEKLGNIYGPLHIFETRNP